MPCGCRKNRNLVPGTLEARRSAQSLPSQEPRVAVYQFVKNGEVVGTTENPSEARQKSKVLGASVRVTSRPVEAGEPAAVG